MSTDFDDNAADVVRLADMVYAWDTEADDMYAELIGMVRKLVAPEHRVAFDALIDEVVILIEIMEEQRRARSDKIPDDIPDFGE